MDLVDKYLIPVPMQEGRFWRVIEEGRVRDSDGDVLAVLKIKPTAPKTRRENFWVMRAIAEDTLYRFQVDGTKEFFALTERLPPVVSGILE